MSDFTNITEVNGVFTSVAESATVDFVPSGDLGIITTTGNLFGEGGFGEGPFGGTQTVILSSATNWTNVETP